MKTESLEIIECEQIPNDLEEGKLYVSERFTVAIHLCACGCKEKTVTPLDEWSLTRDKGGPTLRPSIGNFMGEHPYHAHYFVTKGKIEWC